MKFYMYNIPDDEKICTEIRKKNLNNWFEEVLYIKYRDELWSYGHALCNSNEKKNDIAQDIIQDVFIVIIERIRSGKFVSINEGHILNSMKRTFKNMLNNYRKKSLKIPLAPRDIPIPDFMEETEQTPYNAIALESFKELNPECKEIISAVYYMGMSMREINSNYTFISSEEYARKYKYKCLEKLRNIAKSKLNSYYKNK